MPSCADIPDVYAKLCVLNSKRRKNNNDITGMYTISKESSNCNGKELKGRVFFIVIDVSSFKLFEFQFIKNLSNNHMKILLTIICFSVSVFSHSLSNIQTRLKQSKFQGSLPSIQRTIDHVQQQSQYSKMTQSYRFSEFQGDPVYNTKFYLVNNRNMQAFYFIGMETGQLKVQIHVRNNFQGKLKGVKVYLIDHTQKSVEKFVYITKLSAFYIDQLVSNLYQLRFVIDEQIDQKRDISLMMNMQSPKAENKIDKPITQLLESLKKTSDKIDDTFLGSLGEWDRISTAMKAQVQQQTAKTDMFLFQMILIGLINIVSYYLLRREMNKKILV